MHLGKFKFVLRNTQKKKKIRCEKFNVTIGIGVTAGRIWPVQEVDKISLLLYKLSKKLSYCPISKKMFGEIDIFLTKIALCINYAVLEIYDTGQSGGVSYSANDIAPDLEGFSFKIGNDIGTGLWFG